MSIKQTGKWSTDLEAFFSLGVVDEGKEMHYEVWVGEEGEETMVQKLAVDPEGGAYVVE